MSKRIFSNIARFFSQKLTLMVVPHSTLRQLQFQFSLSFILFLGLLSLSLVSWAVIVVTKNIDYWTLKANHQILKVKVSYLAYELKKNRESVDQVKEVDTQLRQLLKMGTKQAIIENSKGSLGKGGPALYEISLLQKTLNNRLWQISDAEILEESLALQKESTERIQSYKEISEEIAYQRKFYRSMPRGWPAAGRMTSHFGMRTSPLSGHAQFHTGIDIANTRGTLIRATAPGIVRHASWEGGYGRLVIIDHNFGYATYYGHNSTISVKPGQTVERGDIIATMGSSGSATGCHTHYEVWRNGQSINPWNYLYSKVLIPQKNLSKSKLSKKRG